MFKKLLFADYLFTISAIGISTYFIVSLLLYVQIEATPKAGEFPTLKLLAGIGFYLFLGSSILLWFRAIIIAVRHHNFTFERLYIAIAGNIFTAYIFYVLYRKKEDYLLLDDTEH